MTTNVKCKLGVRVGMFVLCASVMLTSGCGAAGGQMWYFLGVGQGEKIPAEFTLPKGKLVVLVDDVHGVVTWPQTMDLLAKDLGEELLRHNAVESVISQHSVQQLRRMDPDFDRTPASVVGQKLGAKTVIWIRIEDFYAPREVEDTASAARMSASLRVLDATERMDRSEVRIWPDSSSGHIVQSELSATEVSRLSGLNAKVHALANDMAVTMGRLFYQHTYGDLDEW